MISNMDSISSRSAADETVVVQVSEEYHIAQAQRRVLELAESIGFFHMEKYYVATAVSELAANLVYHATRGGEMAISAVWKNYGAGIQVVVEDHGPGIADIEQAMQDGFTTNGGLGGGLPGAKRLMDEFEISSEVPTGTRVVATKWQLCK